MGGARWGAKGKAAAERPTPPWASGLLCDHGGVPPTQEGEEHPSLHDCVCDLLSAKTLVGDRLQIHPGLGQSQRVAPVHCGLRAG